MKLIGLNGRKHSGKDTAFKIIEELAARQGKVAKRICFADQMKLSGVRALGFDPRTVEEAVTIADIIKEQARIKVMSGSVPLTVGRLGDDSLREGALQTEITRFDISGREFWQRYGTEAHREVFGNDFWVDALLPVVDNPQDYLQKTYPGVDFLIETTTRFANEATRIKQYGGSVWWIDADTRLGPLAEDAHISEQPLPSHLVEVRIPNNESLEQFEATVASVWSVSEGTVYRAHD